MKRTPVTKIFLSLLLATSWLLGAQAHAVSYVGTFLSDSNQYSLIHESATPGATNDSADWLRFLPGQEFLFDITGDMLTTSGSQSFDLESNNGATATFIILNLVLDLSGPNGLAGGSLDYDLDGLQGTFTFVEAIYGGSGYNTSSFDGSTFTGFIWGGDDVNNLGFDGAITGSPVPLPGAIILFGSALVALGRRRIR